MYLPKNKIIMNFFIKGHSIIIDDERTMQSICYSTAINERRMNV